MLAMIDNGFANRKKVFGPPFGREQAGENVDHVVHSQLQRRHCVIDVREESVDVSIGWQKIIVAV